ncbi:TPA: TIGR04540 family protein [bacterium]|nr:TIGR04540 family protein [bacterium]
MNQLQMIHTDQNQFQNDSKSTKGVPPVSILKNPTTVKMLANQIILACDGYIALKMTEKQFRELISHYAALHGKKLFSKDGLNPTVTIRIGKKRAELVNIMLSGFQMGFS